MAIVLMGSMFSLAGANLTAGLQSPHLLLPRTSCSSITSCDACSQNTNLGVECFWCENKCYNAATGSYPKICKASDCVSDYSMSSCTGICPADKVPPKGFDVTTAQCMLGVSNASYCESENAAYLCSVAYAELGLKLSTKFDCNATYNSGVVVLVPNKNIIIAGFRGTEFTSWENLVQDLSSFSLDPADSIPSLTLPAGVSAKLGHGFVVGYTSIRGKFWAALKKGLEEMRSLTGNLASPKLYITGHSLGGAIGAIAALDLKYNSVNGTIISKFSSVNLWTYESPRPGDPGFAKVLQHVTTEQWNVENYFDLIPKLPGMDNGFAHGARIAMVGPHAGEIRELSQQADAATHESTAKLPTYYHTEAAVMASLNGLPGAAPAPGRPEQCAQLHS